VSWSEVSWGTSDLGTKCLETFWSWVRSLSGPKCPGSKVAGKHLTWVKVECVDSEHLFETSWWIRKSQKKFKCHSQFITE